MIPQVNDIQRKVVVTVLISDKIDFKIKKVTRAKDRHFTTTKDTIHQEDIHLSINTVIGVLFKINDTDTIKRFSALRSNAFMNRSPLPF